jgi:glutathione S-transferase
MSDVIVHGPPQSTFVRTVRLALEEKGVAYELAPVEFKQPSHLELHPFGRVPAFDHGDFHLYETNAILAYVDAAFDGPSLVPADPRSRARMDQWVSSVACYFDADATRAYVLEYVFPKGEAPDRAKIDAALVHVRHHLGVAEAALAGSAWLVGDEMSLADLMLAPVVFYVMLMPEGKELLGATPNLRRWFKEMRRRPSFEATTPPPPGGG